MNTGLTLRTAHISGGIAAIRAGAQNIAFALPIDNVLKTVAEIISARRRTGQVHGLAVRDMVDASASPVKRWAVVDRVDAGGAGDAAGIKAGDILEKVGDVSVLCAMDVERAFLELPAGGKLEKDASGKPTGGNAAPCIARRSISATMCSASCTQPWVISQRGLSGSHVRINRITSASAAPMPPPPRSKKPAARRSAWRWMW